MLISKCSISFATYQFIFSPTLTLPSPTLFFTTPSGLPPLLFSSIFSRLNSKPQIKSFPWICIFWNCVKMNNPPPFFSQVSNPFLSRNAHNLVCFLSQLWSRQQTNDRTGLCWRLWSIHWSYSLEKRSNLLWKSVFYYILFISHGYHISSLYLRLFEYFIPVCFQNHVSSLWKGCVCVFFSIGFDSNFLLINQTYSAAACISLSKFEAAIEDCKASLALNPNYVKSFARMGYAVNYFPIQKLSNILNGFSVILASRC